MFFSANCRKKGYSSHGHSCWLVTTLGDDFPSLRTLLNWPAEFWRERENLEDEPRAARSVTSTTDENVNQVHSMIIDDRRLTIYPKASTISIYCVRVENILPNELRMTKVCTRCIPRLLKSEEKRVDWLSHGTVWRRYNWFP